MAQQTAVEWLAKELEGYGDPQFCEIAWKDLDSLVERAKQMEKEQIKECWDTAHQAGRFEGNGIAGMNWQAFEKYYNETYGK